ncbi:MAG: adaptor protein MecA [Lachnospiraceae bacterium]|nr:adaptor protein MecA [Lachnospiraceae bacterium]
MVFKRIGKDTVRCILTEQDMVENGLEIEDFFKDKDKVHDFLENIVEQAREEVGYEMKSGMLAMQVMPLPNKGLAITFSENADNSFNSVLEQIKEITGDAIISSEEPDDDVKPDKKLKKFDGRLYRFINMKDVEDFCISIPEEKVNKSILYKNQEDGRYYMIIRKGNLSKKSYDSLCFQAMEYAKLVSDNPAVLVNWQEHHEPMIKKNAIGIIRKIV